jgi:hypothetical protein
MDHLVSIPGIGGKPTLLKTAGNAGILPSVIVQIPPPIIQIPPVRERYSWLRSAKAYAIQLNHMCCPQANGLRFHRNDRKQ